MSKANLEKYRSIGAEISGCGKYRYWLHRGWRNLLPFVMLNPSTADIQNDDPTIKRCLSFAEREGYGGIVVCNLFAYRATNPAELCDVNDPVGETNDVYLEKLSLEYPKIVAAWGAVRPAHRERAKHVCEILTQYGAKLMCLGLTERGDPRHPLYLRSDAPMEPLFWLQGA